MTEQEKYELTQRLRQLANHLENDTPLQHRYDELPWKGITDATLYYLLKAMRRIRPTPEPYEEWHVVYENKSHLFASSPEEAERTAKEFSCGFSRIRHIREVME